MYGEVLSTQAVQELNTRIKQAEHARRARKARKPVGGGRAPRRKDEPRQERPWPATANATDPR